MSSTPSPKSNGASFPDSNIPHPSEDTDMQSVPENTTYHIPGSNVPSDSPAPNIQRQIESFFQRRTFERAENPDLIEPRSDRATNTTVNSTSFSASPNSSRRRQPRDNSPLLLTWPGMNISADDVVDTHLPTIAEVVHAVAGLDSSSRVRAIRRPRRHRRAENHSRRHVQGITRRNQRSRRNAMDVVSGRPVSPSLLSRNSTNMLRSNWPSSNQDADADDEAVDMDPPMDPPLPDPAMNLDTFTARRNVRSRSALYNVMSTSDMEYEDQETHGMNTDLSYNSETLLGNLQPRGSQFPADQRRRSAPHTFTTPVNTDSPSVASTSTSTLSSTTQPQTRPQATGTANTTVSSRKPSQDATVRLWEAMYSTNDEKQQHLETMRGEGVDDIPIAKLSIGESSRR